MHLVQPLRNIYIHTHTHNIERLSRPLVYAFTLVSTTYQLRPYNIDEYYVVSEYINNSTAVRNIPMLSTTIYLCIYFVLNFSSKIHYSLLSES